MKTGGHKGILCVYLLSLPVRGAWIEIYRGILQHFNSYGMRQSLNELHLQEMGKPYPEPEKKPASKCGLFCGYYGSTDDYIKQPEEKEVTDSGSNADA